MFSSSFFDAELVGGAYDRVYAASNFAEYFASFIANGVFPDPATNLQIVANTTPNMTVLASAGLGWINGYYCKNSNPYPMAIAAASGSQARIDSIMLRWDKTARNITTYVKMGTPSANPQPPTVERTPDVYELMLATVLVGAGVTKIVQGNITDKRADTSVCGYVHGVVSQIDTTDLFAQYDEAFQTWFADIQAQLSGDIATNLQNQINNLKNDKLNITAKATTAQAQAGTLDTVYTTPLTTKAHVDYRIPTQAQAEEGTDNTKLMTPLRTKQAMDNSNPIGILIPSLSNLESTGGGKLLRCDGRLCTSSSYPGLSSIEDFGFSVGEVFVLPKGSGANSAGVNRYKLLNNTLFAFGWYSTGSSNVYAAIWKFNSSTRSWSLVYSGLTYSGASTYPLGFTDGEYANGKYVACAGALNNSATSFYSSSDGTSWSPLTGLKGYSKNFGAIRIFYTNGYWYVQQSDQDVYVIEGSLSSGANLSGGGSGYPSFVEPMGNRVVVFDGSSGSMRVTVYNGKSYVTNYTGAYPLYFVSPGVLVNGKYRFLGIHYSGSYNEKKVYLITIDPTVTSNAIEVKSLFSQGYLSFTGMDMDYSLGIVYLYAKSGTGPYAPAMLEVNLLNETYSQIGVDGPTDALIALSPNGIRMVSGGTTSVIYSKLGVFPIKSLVDTPTIMSVVSNYRPMSLYAFGVVWIPFSDTAVGNDYESLALTNAKFVLPSNPDYFIRVK